MLTRPKGSKPSPRPQMARSGHEQMSRGQGHNFKAKARESRPKLRRIMQYSIS